MSELPSFTLQEIAKHNTPDDCWVVIKRKVYNVTSYIQSHPGGKNVFIRNAGKDVSFGFSKVNHGDKAYDIMDQLLIGEVKVYLHFYFIQLLFSIIINNTLI